ncbi:hypothetical protein WR25_06623 isoform H [Diploscapter pachys]|nr:hypothetical protein WR25_06623 isoform D [Diploscapter pachys]PAV89992.1 hypothetical protein WR25_06623 isoform E [Diploscapter pachys]PAV89994.1 hypothetical protein WR25_06623 isoform G [Diploscapter pachys]PAV89995.1 hypothetical protein WR25_06623 isoform H [Diploscapter pachys]
MRDGLCRVGWATLKGSRNIGTDKNSYGFGGTGKKSHAKQFDDYGQSFSTNDVLGCFLDLDGGFIWWSKNGVEFPVAYEIKQHTSPEAALFPTVLLQNSSMTVNFGDSPFAFPPKNGFMPISKAPDSCVRWNVDEPMDTSGPGQVDTKSPLCLILEPTRELVEQTHNNLVTFASKLEDPKIRCISLAAGVDVNQTLAALESGVDIVTGTPSRILDLIQTRVLSVSHLQFIVLDEADQLVANKQGGSMGGLIRKLMGSLPLQAVDGTRHQMIVCSATLHNFDVTNFANRYMSFPQWIDLKGMDSVAETVHHSVCHVDANADKQWIRLMHAPNHLEDDHVHQHDQIKPGLNDKNTISLGTKILKGIYVLRAIQALNMKNEQCIVFCRTKQQCDHMETFLRHHGYNASCLHGDRSPQERSSTLAAFKEKKLNFLVCTDVAARGLDVSGVPFVINVTMPDDKAMYVHRIGRVGRADRMGLSISLVSQHEEKVWYHKCSSKGLSCKNTRDVQEGGCTIWYNEPQLLADVEEHLGQTIAIVDSDFQVPVDEFDGKIVYGAKRKEGATFVGHAPQLAAAVAQLADLETAMQLSYLNNVKDVYKKIEVL